MRAAIGLASIALSYVVMLPLQGCGGSSSGPVDGDRAFAHVEALVKIGPRPFGSPELAKAAEYIEGELKKLGLAPKRHEVLEPKEKKTIRNLYVQIDGADPVNGPILMLGAHYDTKLTEGHADPAHNMRFVGAIDGGGAPAVLLELARVLVERKEKPKPNVWLYWIDAEESLDFHWNDDRALLGSKAFVKWLDEQKLLPRVKAFVLLDLIGDKNIKIDRDGSSHRVLQDLFAKAAQAMGESDRVYKEKSEFKDDHHTFRDRGVPSIVLIDFTHRVPQHLIPEEHRRGDHPDYVAWWHTPEDDLDKMSPEALAFAGNLVMQAFPDLEKFCTK